MLNAKTKTDKILWLTEHFKWLLLTESYINILVEEIRIN